MNRFSIGRVARLVLVALVLSGAGPATQAAWAKPGNGGLPRILVLSNRADLISGGDALVQVVLPGRVDPADVRVRLNGRDVTSAFAVRADGRFVGLVEGLAVGDNRLTASMRKGPTIHLTITNHPIGGPVFAGPQVQPWICKNVQFGLAPPADAQCNSPTTYGFFYKHATTGMFLPYDPSSPPPAGQIATTTTDQGATVPYIVRRERGTIDRGIYDVAVLFDPARPWQPWASQRGWNHKVLWLFGGGTAPHHSNGAPLSVLDDLALSRGFLVANNSLNIRGKNANDVVSAEAMMMLKEHVAETYGSIRYTIGAGCSGGSIQQHALAANYPGLLDGIQPNCSYQDSWTTGNEVGDCHLLLHYFSVVAPGTFTPAQQAAVEGTRDTSVCTFWELTFASVNNPSLATNCDMTAPPYLAMVYNPITNPTGVRCTIQDYQVAIWGTRPQDGFAKRPFDNAGIQYGLEALNSGAISATQFVDLNQRVGGVDIDHNFQPARTVADAGTQGIAYRTGAVVNGRELAKVPMIDLRGSHNVLDIHTDYHTYAMRARLDEANGHHANQIVWTWAAGPGPFQGITPSAEIARKSFLLIDAWLSNIEADTAAAPLEVKVLRNKPADAVDSCFVGGQQITDQATCSATFPYYGDSRIVAGGPLASDVMQCQLKPLDPADYTVAFSADQWARLQQAFPSGVCDWSKPAVGEQPSVPWLTFAGGPGGQPLGPAPTSHPGPPR